MKPDEAVAKGFMRICLPDWDDGSYYKLFPPTNGDLLFGRKFEVWRHHDTGGDGSIRRKRPHTELTVGIAWCDEFVPFKGKLFPEDS